MSKLTILDINKDAVENSELVGNVSATTNLIQRQALVYMNVAVHTRKITKATFASWM